MPTLKHFTELECRQESRAMVRTVFEIVTNEPALNREYELKDQIKRAALSTMNNIAEGFGRYSTRESIRFLNIAKASSFEVESMTYVMEDMALAGPDDLSVLRNRINSTQRKIGGLLKYLAGLRDERI